MAELAYITGCDDRSRAAQFAVRTAERAQCLAQAAGTDPVDELLDARARVTSNSAREVLERSIGYVRADQILDASLQLQPAR
jgi:hypothetical protein